MPLVVASLRQRLARLQVLLDLSGRNTEVGGRRLQSKSHRTAVGGAMADRMLVMTARAAGGHRRDSTTGEQCGECNRERDLAFDSAIHEFHVAKGA